MNTKPVFKAAVGSKNYNLNIEGSDDDYKLFVIPTFEHLYKGEFISKSIVSQEKDINVVDIRNLPMLMKKSNVNFTEVLFSKDCKIYRDTFNNILYHREEIARMNLPYLFSACVGMAYQRHGKIRDKVSGEFKPKNAYQSIRILDFLVRYRGNEFESFGDAMRYQDDDPMRRIILSIRNNEVNEEGYGKMYEELLNRVRSFEDDYISKSLDSDLMEYVENEIFNIVQHEVYLRSFANSFHF